MTKQTLQKWYEEEKISVQEKEIINKFGVNDYYPEYVLKELKKICYWDNVLEKNLDKVPKKIKQFSFFSTEWNNNLALVININEEEKYCISLIVYEFPYSEIPEIFEVRRIFREFSQFVECQDRVYQIEKKLRSKTPIIYNSFCIYLLHSKDYLFEEVKSYDIQLPSLALEVFPDEYIKPLDIIKVHWKTEKGREMLHSGIYLGNDKVCHITPKEESNNAYSNYYEGKEPNNRNIFRFLNNLFLDKGWTVEITDLRNFLKFGEDPFKLNRLHSIIPYKSNSLVVLHLTKVMEATEEYYEKRRWFNILNNNCEHFVNLIKYGIDFSEHVEIWKVYKKHPGNDVLKYFYTESELQKSSIFFQELSKGFSSLKRQKEIENYVDVKSKRQGLQREEIILESRIEIQPKFEYGN